MTWLSIGRRRPAKAATRELLPATERPTLFRPDGTARRLDAGGAAVLDDQARHFAILHDVDAAVAGTARVAPGDGVVPRRAAALLQEAALNGEARIIEIQKWQHGAYLLTVEQIRIDAM